MAWKLGRVFIILRIPGKYVKSEHLFKNPVWMVLEAG